MQKIKLNNGMEAIKTLDTRASLFFDHRDPAMAKWLGTYKSVI